MGAEARTRWDRTGNQSSLGGGGVGKSSGETQNSWTPELRTGARPSRTLTELDASRPSAWASLRHQGPQESSGTPASAWARPWGRSKATAFAGHVNTRRVSASLLGDSLPWKSFCPPGNDAERHLISHGADYNSVKTGLLKLFPERSSAGDAGFGPQSLRPSSTGAEPFSSNVTTAHAVPPCSPGRQRFLISIFSSYFLSHLVQFSTTHCGLHNTLSVQRPRNPAAGLYLPPPHRLCLFQHK